MKEKKTQDNLIEFLHQLKEKGIPKEDYSQYIDQFIAKKARKKGIPISGQFELTPLCNLDCKMCFVHMSKFQLGNIALLSVEQWKNIVLQAKKAGLMKANLTGGECLIYPGFKEIYEYLHELGIQVTINTNGILLQGQMLQFLAKNPPHRMQISLYGSNDKVYEEVTGHKVFSRLMKNLENAKRTGLNYHIAITPNPFMKDDLANVVRLAHNLGVTYNINDALSDPREETGRRGSVQDLDYQEYIKLYRLKAELDSGMIAKENDLKIPPVGVAYEGQEYKKGIICGAARSGFHVDWKGKMHPCIEYQHIEEDLLKKSFKECWDSINQWGIHHLRPRECNNCFYANKCQHCAAIHDLAGEGNVNRRVCEKMIQKEKAGLFDMKCVQDI